MTTSHYNDVIMDKEFSVEALEKAIKELFPDGLQLTRIYPDGKEHHDIPGLYYASDKFWEEFDIQFKKAIQEL